MNPLVRRSACLLLSLSAMSVAHAQTYVDPTNGADTTGGGSLAQPFKTITFCVTQLAPGPAQIVLLPGVYAYFTGEQWPVSLPPAVEIRAQVPGTVLAATDIISAVIPALFVLPPGSQSARFVDVDVLGHSGAIVCDLAPGDQLALTIERCIVRGGWGVIAHSDAAVATIVVQDSVLTGVNSGAKLVADNGGIVNAVFERCEFSKGMYGLQTGSMNGGTLTVTTTSSSFHDQMFGAVSTNRVPPATLQCELSHDVFYNVGKKNSTPTVKDIGPGDSTFTISHSIFSLCPKELPGFGPTYAVDHCIMAVPVAGAGNFTADPMFVDALDADFHLKPGSPAIDAGGPTTLAADVEGDPVPGHPTLLGPPTADIGLDEFYARSHYVWPRSISLENTAKLRCVGPPLSPVILLTSGTLGNTAFAPIYHLGPPAAIGLIGATDATGVLEVTFPPFLDLQLLNVVAHMQLAFPSPTNQPRFSFDVRTISFAP